MEQSLLPADPLVVYSFLPGEQRFVSDRYDVCYVECREPDDYWHGLAAVWDLNRTLVIVEHDMQCSDDLIASLLDCKFKCCTWAYMLWHIHNHQHYAQRKGLKPPAGGEWVEAGESWCDYSGIGFCKIAPEARVGALAESHWSHLDTAVSRAVVSRFHVHWPEVEHHHG